MTDQDFLGYWPQPLNLSEIDSYKNDREVPDVGRQIFVTLERKLNLEQIKELSRIKYIPNSDKTFGEFHFDGENDLRPFFVSEIVSDVKNISMIEDSRYLIKLLGIESLYISFKDLFPGDTAIHYRLVAYKMEHPTVNHGKVALDLCGVRSFFSS